MKWLILIFLVSATYSDARPKVEIIKTSELAKPLEDLVPKLDSLAGKLTDLSNKMQ